MEEGNGEYHGFGRERSNRKQRLRGGEMTKGDAIVNCAYAALRECLNLKQRERLLVVCDPPCFEVGSAFFEAGNRLCRETVMVQIRPRKENGNEPPEPTDEWFGQFEVAVMPTSKSLSHTRARRNASEKGTRIATLPGITPETFIRTMNTDWAQLGTLTRKVAAQLSSARKITIRTNAGTDFSFETGGRRAKADDGKIGTPGSFGNLPAGEAYLAPLEGTAEGTLVIDGSFPLVGSLSKPLVMRVRKGEVVEVSGHPCRRDLNRIFNAHGKAARNIAEFGIGTLDTARVSGNILEDEKVKGTIHVAVGDNASMGGGVQVPIHLDGIVVSPSVWLDGALWMSEGVIV
ncbi:MAG: aminopeptidase [Chitinivibrionales bacterium]|nr:aminopeptidase [Chitinivibrionales bacterium]MBD3357505.1 aminopeptidase [Chitinivibrionales bacterium]